MNTWKRRALAVLAVALLSVPSALGVFKALEPSRGLVGAALAAAGFEAVYLSTAVLVLTSDLRAYARRVALAAVATAIILNTLADYQVKVPGGLASWAAAQRLFDPLALVLSLVESAPLAGLAYAMAELLHRLGEATPDTPQAPRPPRRRWSWRWPDWLLKAPPRPALEPVYRAETRQSSDLARDPAAESPPARPEPRRAFTCKRCGMGPFDFAGLGRHAKTECTARQAASAD